MHRQSVAAPQREGKERAKEGANTVIELRGLLEPNKTSPEKASDSYYLLPLLRHSMYKQVTFCTVFYTVESLSIEYDNTLGRRKTLIVSLEIFLPRT